MTINTLNKLYIEPSSACNLKCKMCFRNNWFDERLGLMSAEVWKSIRDSLILVNSDKPKTVMFGGMGEPLMNKNIFNMIKDIKALKIETQLLTNASLLNENCIDKLLKSGLDMLWISVDGFNRETYEMIQKGSQFDEMIKYLEYFKSKNGACRLGLTFVMMKENLFELGEINRFADRIKADMINLSFVIPSEKLLKADSVYDRGYPVGKMKRFNSMNERKLNFCPFIEEGACFIRWDGEIAPCMQLLHNSYTYLFEEKRKVYRHSFGNIKQNSLHDVWNGMEYTLFRDKVHKFEFPDCTMCDGCDDRLENTADCMYNKCPTCGACLWAQGIARCP